METDKYDKKKYDEYSRKAEKYRKAAGCIGAPLLIASFFLPPILGAGYVIGNNPLRRADPEIRAIYETRKGLEEVVLGEVEGNATFFRFKENIFKECNSPEIAPRLNSLTQAVNEFELTRKKVISLCLYSTVTGILISFFSGLYCALKSEDYKDKAKAEHYKK